MSEEQREARVLLDSEKEEILQKYKYIINKILDQANDLRHRDIDLPDLIGAYTGKYIKEYLEEMTASAIDALQDAIDDRQLIEPIDCNLEDFKQEEIQYVYVECRAVAKKEPSDTESYRDIIYNNEYEVELSTTIEDDKTIFSASSGPVYEDIKENIPVPRRVFWDELEYAKYSLNPDYVDKVNKILSDAEAQCGELSEATRERLKNETLLAYYDVLLTASVYTDEKVNAECSVSENCISVTCKATVPNDDEDPLVVDYVFSAIVINRVYTVLHYEVPSLDLKTRTISVTASVAGIFVT